MLFYKALTWCLLAIAVEPNYLLDVDSNAIITLNFIGTAGLPSFDVMNKCNAIF